MNLPNFGQNESPVYISQYLLRIVTMYYILDGKADEIICHIQ